MTSKVLYTILKILDSCGISHKFFGSSVGTLARLLCAQTKNHGLLPHRRRLLFSGQQQACDSRTVVGKSHGGKATERVVDCLPSYSAEVKN
jgi:hypothetical protein